jgi:signal peptidase I
MSPTLLIGEHFFVDLEAYATQEPKLGDVVALWLVRSSSNELFTPDQRPELPEHVFFKRIVGLPRDVIEFRKGVLVRNGEAQ